MAAAESNYECSLCKKTFSHHSSLSRHSKKCVLGVRPTTRQKACRYCTVTKSRCDLVRPSCSRCVGRKVTCDYSLATGGPRLPERTEPEIAKSTQLALSDTTSAGDSSLDQGLDSIPDVEFEFPVACAFTNLQAESFGLSAMALSGLDNWMLAAGAPDPHVMYLPPKDTVLHSMQSLFRVFRSWPRMMAKGFQLPPIIHGYQFHNGIPKPLANCITLCKMWSGQCGDEPKIVVNAVRREINSILEKFTEYSQPDLIAAIQSAVLYGIILLFPCRGRTCYPTLEASLFTSIRQLAVAVTSSGLILEEETARERPDWHVWTHIEAKRRAVLSLYLLHWAYGVYHSVPTYKCVEISRMPAPSPKFLWQATDESVWRSLYTRWLAACDDDFLSLAELLRTRPGLSMGRRPELWVEDMDEFGMLIFSTVNANKRESTT